MPATTVHWEFGQRPRNHVHGDVGAPRTTSASSFSQTSEAKEADFGTLDARADAGDGAKPNNPLSHSPQDSRFHLQSPPLPPASSSSWSVPHESAQLAPTAPPDARPLASRPTSSAHSLPSASPPSAHSLLPTSPPSAHPDAPAPADSSTTIAQHPETPAPVNLPSVSALYPITTDDERTSNAAIRHQSQADVARQVPPSYHQCTRLASATAAAWAVSLPSAAAHRLLLF